MGKQNEEGRLEKKIERSEYFLGMDAALRRAAIKARKRAIDTTGSVPTWRKGKLVYDTEVSAAWPNWPPATVFRLLQTERVNHHSSFSQPLSFVIPAKAGIHGLASNRD